MKYAGLQCGARLGANIRGQYSVEEGPHQRFLASTTPPLTLEFPKFNDKDIGSLIGNVKRKVDFRMGMSL